MKYIRSTKNAIFVFPQFIAHADISSILRNLDFEDSILDAGFTHMEKWHENEKLTYGESVGLKKKSLESKLDFDNEKMFYVHFIDEADYFNHPTRMQFICNKKVAELIKDSPTLFKVTECTYEVIEVENTFDTRQFIIVKDIENNSQIGRMLI